jgi:hypothetical protein
MNPTGGGDRPGHREFEISLFEKRGMIAALCRDAVMP